MTQRILWGLAPVLAAALWAAPAARADEIVYVDLDTCQQKTLRVAEVTAETWAQVSFRRKRAGRGPVEQIPTLQVIEVRREDGGPEAERLASIRTEIRRKNFGEAVRMARSLASGGWKQDPDSGERYYVSFRKGDPTSRNERPDWRSEYGHYLLAKALYERAARKGDREGLEAALYALDDFPVQGREETSDGGRKPVKIKTGGFLARFAGGNSRFYADAMALEGDCLVALGKYAEAAKVYEELSQRAISVPLHPRYAYEAAIGPGKIKERQGDLAGAIDAFNRAAGVVLSLLDKEQRVCLATELGRAYSRARILAADVKLRQAEKAGNPALFTKLKVELKAESPEALLRRYAAKSSTVKNALVRGARDPMVRAVASNGIGLAELKAENWEAAILAFKEVTVVHFQIRAQAARATYYLVQAARGAAGAAKGNAKAKALYEKMAAEAKQALETLYGDTEWARKG